MACQGGGADVSNGLETESILLLVVVVLVSRGMLGEVVPFSMGCCAATAVGASGAMMCVCVFILEQG